MLKCKKFIEDAKLPVCANPGSDLGYDLFAAEDVALHTGVVTKIRTGIGVEFTWGQGALLRDRSSMAAKGITLSGGVIDAGYRGEIIVMLTLSGQNGYERIGGLRIKKGDKIAQMVPVNPLTLFKVIEVTELADTARGDGGFGSTGA